MKVRKIKNLWVCALRVDGHIVEFVSRESRMDAIHLALRGIGWSE